MDWGQSERPVAKALQSAPGVKEVLEVSHPGAFARVTAGPQATAEGGEGVVAKAGYRARVKDEARHAASPPPLSPGRSRDDPVIVGGGSAGSSAAVKAGVPRARAGGCS